MAPLRWRSQALCRLMHYEFSQDRRSTGLSIPTFQKNCRWYWVTTFTPDSINQIGRPIFLPPIDVSNAATIDPTVDTTVTTEAIAGASVFVAAGTLDSMEGEKYTGPLSITEVPTHSYPSSPSSQYLFPDLVVTIQPGESGLTLRLLSAYRISQATPPAR